MEVTEAMGESRGPDSHGWGMVGGRGGEQPYSPLDLTK